MHRELVERRRWITEDHFLHALNYCMMLPGPEAQQLATYIGWLMHNIKGGLVAGGLFVLPSAFILLGLSYVYAAYGQVPAVAGVLLGLKPVVVAIVAEAVLRIGRRALRRRTHFAIAILAFVAIYFLSVPFPLIVLGAGLIGLAGANEAVIHDDVPRLSHTKPSRARTVRIVAVGFLLWMIPFAAVTAWRGSSSLHAEEYRFFTEAAFVTFGGAYAVLAYVTQAIVGSFGWLTRTQAIDGLALAETTPGPLIMVLQFVGFMAAWNHPQGMSPLSSGVLGAVLTTYATFLPSFLLIFLGAPYIEALRGNRSLSGALSGITAAVVGVILNLGLIFGSAVTRDWFSLALMITAFAALVRLKLNILLVVSTAGLIGLLRTLAVR